MKVFISLGSNIGNSIDFLKKAIELISKNSEIQIIKKSSLMKTSPIGQTKQNDFINQIVLIDTNILPLDLLNFFKEIESSLGRVQRKKWKEREIDIDIICYENFVLDHEKLKIPHPELFNRLFIILGALEIDPTYILEGTNTSFNEIYQSIKKKLTNQKVEFISKV